MSTTAHSRFIKLTWTVGMALAVAALVGCGGDGDAAEAATGGFTTIEAASIEAGDAVPAPVEDVVLTVDAGSGDAVSFDLPSLERTGLVEGELYEPFEKQRLTYTGVELRSVLDVAGVDRAADIHLVALDDYSIDLTAEELDAGGILLATRFAGKAIEVPEGGPIRLVFLDDAASGEDDDQWIWSVARVDVKE